ncbi:MAG: hypothetical protein NVSMB57_13140 [Actinomycetota bacterium]
MDRKLFLSAGAGTLVAGCNVGASVRYEEIDDAGEPLRTAFNRDAEKVRILMLVSPT